MRWARNQSRLIKFSIDNALFLINNICIKIKFHGKNRMMFAKFAPVNRMQFASLELRYLFFVIYVYKNIGPAEIYHLFSFIYF